MAGPMTQITAFNYVLDLLLVMLFFFNSILAIESGSMLVQDQNRNGYNNDLTIERSNVPTQQSKPELQMASFLLDRTISSNKYPFNVNEMDMLNLAPNIGFPKFQNMVKRAPNGFIGMRGKKTPKYTDFSNENIQDTLKQLDPLWQARQDNDFNKAYDNIRTKKTPTTTFYGVRGKKYSSELNNINSILYKLEEDRVRQSMLEDFFNKLTAQTENEITKRAPTGFTGMRGKRPMVDFYEGADLGEEKRGPTNAFVGVRGKKDVSHQNFKRSSTEAYRRGKNQRFVDFNNKFVAVRGKKDENYTGLATNSNEEAQHLLPVNEEGTIAAAARKNLYFNMQTLPLSDIHFKHSPTLDTSQAVSNNFLGRDAVNVQ